jgi:hypothetical protein
MQHATSYDQTEGRQKLREWARESLPLTGWFLGDFPRDGSLVQVPVLSLATRGRPDVQDLARLHLQEGHGYQGDTWAQWVFVTGQGPLWAFLDVRLKSPVHCDFKLAFRLDKHQVVLEAAAASGLVGIALKPLRIVDGKACGPMLFLESNTRELRGILRAWETLDALGVVRTTA